MLLFAKIAGLVFLILGSWEDMRTREVPDWLNFALIFLGVASSTIFSIYYWNHEFIVNSLAGLAVCVAFAYMMFYTAQWGGGDAKLLMGMGALIGLDVFNPGIPELLIFLVNIFLVGAIYGLLWSFYLALRNWKDFRKAFKDRFYSKKTTRLRKLNLFVSALLLVGIILSPLTFKVFFFTLILLSYLILYMWVFIGSVEECCMIKNLDIKDLTEGDWVVEEVKVGKKRICGPGDLGLTKEQIKELKGLKAKGKIKQVKVKEGIPFVPSFLMGFIITILLGNWLVYFA